MRFWDQTIVLSNLICVRFMKKMIMAAAAFAAAVFVTGCGRTADRRVEYPMNVIFETDLGNDIDDALALDMIYKYMDADSLNLLSISINKPGTAPAVYADIMNRWYGYPDVPIAVLREGADCEADAVNYAKAVVDMKDASGNFVFARGNDSIDFLPVPEKEYRKILSAAEDSSVTVISTGFFTNLARLLETGTDEYSALSGRELVEKKVKSLCCMAGCFNDTIPSEYNVKKDIPAARKVLAEWPGRITLSPFELGFSIRYPAESIESDFVWAAHHPMVEAYKIYRQMPYSRQTWDLTAVLYAMEPDAGYFGISPDGVISIDENGRTVFTPSAGGKHHYLTVDGVQKRRIKAHLVSMVTRRQKVCCVR